MNIRHRDSRDYYGFDVDFGFGEYFVVVAAAAAAAVDVDEPAKRMG